MKILYVAFLLPKCILKRVLEENKVNYVVAPQKFHRTIVRGLVDSGNDVVVLSYLPEGMEHLNEYEEDGVKYIFIKCGRVSGIRHLQLIASIFRYVNYQYRRKGCRFGAIICDVLNVSTSIGALLTGKCYKIKVTAIVTDLLGISSHEEHRLVNRIAARFARSIRACFDRYVLLTEQMSEVVNRRRRPYIVMEGICDGSVGISLYREQSSVKKLFYAGGRPSKDGLDMLIAAFDRIEDENVELHIYGNIEGVVGLSDNSNPRIFCHGIVDNDEIIREEQKAFLLINPRPTQEEYTKYSFPSKLMEYMSSGVPVVTTKLPGIPNSYFDYIYVFNECNIECYYDTLIKLLKIPFEELSRKGQSARQFVIEQKNYKVQTMRVLDLINR